MILLVKSGIVVFVHLFGWDRGNDENRQGSNMKLILGRQVGGRESCFSKWHLGPLYSLIVFCGGTSFLRVAYQERVE